MRDARLLSAGLHADPARLQAQVDVSWSREVRALEALGLGDGMAILEAGSGPGFVTERLLATYPHSTITSIDIDPAMSDLARTRLGHVLGSRLEVHEASICMLPFLGDTFDFALARYVLQHVAAPDLALSEMIRVLKPGGRVAILDIDADIGGILAPAFPVIRATFHKLTELQSRLGGDRQIGRKLWRLLKQTGFVDVDLQALVLHSDELGRQAFALQYEPARIRQWVAYGAITESEWEAYALEYDELMDSPDSYILEVVLLASGTKPSNGEDGR